MERICIAALTFFKCLIIILSILLYIFVLGNSSAQQKTFFMNKYLKLYLNGKGVSKFGKPYLQLYRVSPRPHYHFLIWK